MTDSNSPKRNRRGQSGCPKELQQGFYSTAFDRSYIEDLKAVNNTSISDEVAMFRVQTRRLLEFSNMLEPDLDSIISITRTLGTCATNLANLLQAESKLKEGEKDQVAAEVSRALADVVEEFKL